MHSYLKKGAKTSPCVVYLKKDTKNCPCIVYFKNRRQKFLHIAFLECSISIPLNRQTNTLFTNIPFVCIPTLLNLIALSPPNDLKNILPK